MAIKSCAMSQVAPAPIEMERAVAADPGEQLVNGTDVPYGEMEIAVHRAPDTVIGLTMTMQGGNVVVDSVYHFHQSELKAGDVIRKVNGEPVSTAAEVLAIFEGDKKSEFTGTASIYRDRPPTPPPEPQLKPSDSNCLPCVGPNGECCPVSEAEQQAEWQAAQQMFATTTLRGAL